MRKAIAISSCIAVIGLSFYAGVFQRAAVAPLNGSAPSEELKSDESVLERSIPDDANATDAQNFVADPDEPVARANFIRSPPPASLLPTDQDSPFGTLVASLFESQPLDQTWAPAMEAYIYEIVATQVERAFAVAAHCRTNVCRVELIVASEDQDYATFMNAFDPLRTGDRRVTEFIDTHRGQSPMADTAQIWQAYLVGSDVSEEISDEVARWARSRRLLRE